MELSQLAILYHQNVRHGYWGASLLNSFDQYKLHFSNRFRLHKFYKQVVASGWRGQNTKNIYIYTHTHTLMIKAWEIKIYNKIYYRKYKGNFFILTSKWFYQLKIIINQQTIKFLSSNPSQDQSGFLIPRPQILENSKKGIHYTEYHRKFSVCWM